jgi:uncharacterized protein
MKCPICHKETSWKDNPDRPFCSERCKLIDLGKWAGGDYRLGSSQSSEIEQEKHEVSEESEDELKH